MKYYIVVNNEKQGPYSFDDLAGMNLRNETLVWRDGLESWIVAGELPELASIITPPLEPHVVKWSGEEPVAPAKAQVKRGGCLMPSLVALAVLAVLAVAMVVTNPDKEAHRVAISDLTSEVVNHQLQKSQSPVTSAAGSYLASSLVSKVFDQFFTVRSYGVCSIGEIDVQGFHRKVTLGIFGHVFTFDRADVERELEKWAEQQQGNMEQNLKSKARGLLDMILGPAAQDVAAAASSIGDVASQVSGAIDSVNRAIDSASDALDQLNDMFGDEEED